MRHHYHLGTSIWDIFNDFYAISYIKMSSGTGKYECTYLEMVADFSCFFSLLIIAWMPWKILNPWNHFFYLCNWDIIVILAGVIWTSPMISISYLTLRFLGFFLCRSEHRLLTGHNRSVIRNSLTIGMKNFSQHTTSRKTVFADMVGVLTIELTK